MQPQVRDAGFLDFLKRAPTPSRSNPLSRFLSPDVVEDFLVAKTHMNITGVAIEPLGFGVSVTVSVYEDRPLNRTRTLEGALVPMVNVIEGYLQAPVSARVALDTDNPGFDPTEGRAIYKITIKADYPDMSRNVSARRVADRFVARVAAEETVLTLNVKGSRVTFTLKGPKFQKVEEIQRAVWSFLQTPKAIYMNVSPVRQNPGEATGTFALISTAGAVYGEINRKNTQGALKSMAREAITKKWCDRILMGDGDDVTAMLTT